MSTVKSEYEKKMFGDKLRMKTKPTGKRVREESLICCLTKMDDR